MDSPGSIDQFKEILPKICNKETSADPNGCIPENPLWGHCAVVSLVAQNLFGGELLRASLKGTDFEKGGSHYWNRLPDGNVEDFTESQFGSNYPNMPKAEFRSRDYVLSYPATKTRYKLLAWRLIRALNPGNPIFDDKIYQACFEAALDSPCQKMWFGSVIKDAKYNAGILYSCCNEMIPHLKSLCDPKCIRFSIQSRTESMLGACGHAEEFAMKEMMRRRIPLDECDLYVAGFKTTGLPWFKETPEHTCLRCAVQMYNAGVGMIFVPVVDHWEGITAEKAIKTALVYATKEKTV